MAGVEDGPSISSALLVGAPDISDRLEASAGTGVDRLGRGHHLVGGGRGEHLAGAGGVEHAGADEAGMHRLVARAAAGDQRHLAGRRGGGAGDEAGLGVEELDVVAFYDKPLLKFDRILETYIAYAPRGFKIFLKGLPLWLKQKLHTPRELERGLGGRYRGRYIFTRHHESHAASAFFPSPFERAAVMTLEGSSRPSAAA